jgi:DNA-binding beta-propeller fold protein YncE
MSGIFLSYRRDDSAGWTGRLHEHLVHQWGPDQVFMDIDAIAPGEDFRKAIAQMMRTCDVVMVVIGPNWVTARDDTGARRLDEEGDTHRAEVAAALVADDVRVIPVLVGGAAMPKVSELPTPLKDLAYRHAAVIDDRRFASDVRDMQESLKRFAEGLASRRAAETKAKRAAELEAARRAEEEAGRTAELEAARQRDEEARLAALAAATERAAAERQGAERAAAERAAAEREAARPADEAKQAEEVVEEQAGASRRRVLVAVGAAVAVAALGGGVLLATADDDGTDDRGSGEEGSTAPSTATTDPAEPPKLTVGTAVPVGNGPDGIALDATGLWVAVTQSDSLAVIDPNGGEVVGPPADSDPLQADSDPLAVASGFRSIWVTMRNDGETWRIDPDTGKRQAVIRTPNEPAALAMGRDAVWVASGKGGVWRIDPDTNEVTGPAGVNHPAGLAITGEAVWVTSFDDNIVVQLDPDTLEVKDTLDVGDGPDAVAAGDGFLWVANRRAGTVSRIDLATGESLPPIEVGHEPVGIAIDGDRVWVIDKTDGTLVLIDAPTGKVNKVAVGKQPLGLAVVDETVWVTLGGGQAVVPVTVG